MKALQIAKEVALGLMYMAQEGFDTTRVSKDEAANRMEICKNCPNFQASLQRCALCGCFMRLKTKLLFDPFESLKAKEKMHTVCPEGKW